MRGKLYRSCAKLYVVCGWNLASYLLFCKCCCRCRFQPYDCCHHPFHGVDSVHLQILLTGMCRQCGSWSVTGHIHRKVIWVRPHLCKLARHGPWPVHQRPYMKREIETWLSHTRVGNNSVVDHRSQSSLHCIIVLTDDISDHIEHRDASHGGGCSKTSAYIGQFWWASMLWTIYLMTQRRRCNISEHWQSWELRGLQAAWNHAHWTMMWVSRFM